MPLFATHVPPGGLTPGLEAIAALIDESEETGTPSCGGARKRKAPSLGAAQVHLALSGLSSNDAEPVSQRQRCTDPSAEASSTRHILRASRGGAAVVLVESLLSSPADWATQLFALGKLAEIACTPDGGPVWQAGAIAPCVRALSRFHDVTICWKACAVLQFIALHSAAAAADCVEQGAMHAMASRLVKLVDDDHTKSFEMRWRALLGLQAMCAADSPTGVVATEQLSSCVGLAARLRAIVANAEAEARNELLLEPAGWLLDRSFGTRAHMLDD